MKLILHIGMGKAGSSTLQATFAAHRERLRDLGYFYPILDGAASAHNELALCFNPKSTPRIFRDRPAFDALGYLTALDKAIESAKCPTVILSGEFLFSMPVPSIVALRDHFITRFESIDVVAYLREPTSYYLSFQQQAVKASANIVSPADSRSPLRRGVENYGDVFGAALRLRPMERGQLIAGCVAQDFFGQFLDRTDRAPPMETVDKNESLSAEAMCVMQSLRRLAWADEDNRFDAPTRHVLNILGEIRRELGGQTKAELRDDIAASLVARNAEDLAWLSARHGISFHDIPSAAAPAVEPPGWRSTNFLELLKVAPDDVGRTYALLVRKLATTAIAQRRRGKL